MQSEFLSPTYSGLVRAPRLPQPPLSPPFPLVQGATHVWAHALTIHSVALGGATTQVPVDATQINMAFLISRNVSAAALCDPAALRGVNYPGTVDCKPTGEALMSVLHISMLSGWKWGGVGFLLGFWLVCDVISSVALNVIRIERNTGTRRGSEKEQAEEGDAAEARATSCRCTLPPARPVPPARLH